MKFSHAFVLYLFALAAPSVLAVPLRHGDRCSPDGVDIRCIGHQDDHSRKPSPHLSVGNASPIHGRGLTQPLKSILGGLPLIGPILGPILGSLLDAIGLTEMDVASASKVSLNAEQIAILANFEFALSNAAHTVLTDGSGNPDGGAQSKLKVRGTVPLAELTTAIPVVGPFLLPLASMLGALGLDSVDAKSNSVFNLALLTEDQSMKLAQFQTILRQQTATFLPNSTTPDATSPSKASPDDPGSSPDTSEGNSSDDGAPSPEGTLPMDVPDSTPTSSPAPK